MGGHPTITRAGWQSGWPAGFHLDGSGAGGGSEHSNETIAAVGCIRNLLELGEDLVLKITVTMTHRCMHESSE
jgi:hypothetical protein